MLHFFLHRVRSIVPEPAKDRRHLYLPYNLESYQMMSTDLEAALAGFPDLLSSLSSFGRNRTRTTPGIKWWNASE
jgi:hypothetical protein